MYGDSDIATGRTISNTVPQMIAPHATATDVQEVQLPLITSLYIDIRQVSPATGLSLRLLHIPRFDALNEEIPSSYRVHVWYGKLGWLGYNLVKDHYYSWPPRARETLNTDHTHKCPAYTKHIVQTGNPWQTLNASDWPADRRRTDRITDSTGRLNMCLFRV